MPSPISVLHILTHLYSSIYGDPRAVCPMIAHVFHSPELQLTYPVRGKLHTTLIYHFMIPHRAQEPLAHQLTRSLASSQIFGFITSMTRHTFHYFDIQNL